MELTEDEIIQKYAKLCGHCRGVTLLRYENEGSCISCGHEVIKTKDDFGKISRKKKFH